MHKPVPMDSVVGRQTLTSEGRTVEHTFSEPVSRWKALKVLQDKL